MTDPANRGENFAVPLPEDIQGKISFQSYDSIPRLAGVRMRPLRKHRSENGWFTELLRLDAGDFEDGEGGAPFSVRQLSASFACPGRINAFHIHPRRGQNELWTVVQGQLTIWLADCRAESTTAGMRQQVILSGEEPSQLHIPGGVAHGYRAGPHGALLVYAMDRQFDPGDPDEGRLAWDYFGAALWDEDTG